MNHTYLAMMTAVLGFGHMVSPSYGDEVLVYEEIAASFAPHHQSCQGGHVDWTRGFIIAEGKGIAQSTDDQGQLMAERGATVVAARNALAIATGIKVDASGRAGEMPNGRTMLEGVIKGHEVVEVKWLANLEPPEMRVRLRVPLWGVKSVSAVFHEAHRRVVARTGARRVALVMDRVEVADSVLVIDARGTGLEASLFPVVVTENGDLLYDVSRLSAEAARQRAPARFVETDMTYERLCTGVEEGRWSPEQSVPPRARLASYAEPRAEPPPEVEPAASQPSSQPATRSRRRGRRRVVVKGTAASGEHKTRIVVTNEDAEKLRRSAQGASLLREGQVVIVVDSAAAGIQGRHDSWSGEALVLARSSSP